LLIATVLCAGLAIGFGFWISAKKSKSFAQPPDVLPAQSTPSESPGTPDGLTAQQPVSSPAVEATPPEHLPPAPRRSMQANAANPSSAPSRPEPSPYTRQLVASLQLDPGQGPITPERAAQWKLSLQQLTQQGALAVPAISEFLEKNLDFSFTAVPGGDSLGASSMRMALLEALQTIGGAEALSATVQTLQTTSDPREIAWLARSLEQQAPEQYRQMAVAAANEALAMAAAGKLEGRDVAPLFEILQQLGGAQAAFDLARVTENWNYYGAITLANLADGSGVPALIQMVQDPNAGVKGTRAAALQALAQISASSPEAREALFEQARLGKIPPSSWPGIAAVLGGDMFQMGKPESISSDMKTYHLTHGNQNYFSAPSAAGWTPAQLNEQLAFINRLLYLNPPPLAVQSLQSSQATLSGLLNTPK
jgi:hypothetical protein